MIAEKVDLINTVKWVGLNVDVNPCVESRHVLHERPLCFRYAGKEELGLEMIFPRLKFSQYYVPVKQRQESGLRPEIIVA